MTTPTQSSVQQTSVRDWIVAAVAALLGIALILSSRSLPEGIGALPGPGFFPFVLGLLITLFAAMVAMEARKPKPASSIAEASAGDSPSAAAAPAWRLPVIAMVLVFAYLALWEVVPFLARTPVVALVLTRISGATWLRAIGVAIVMTAFLYLVFQVGLRVSLD